MSKVSFYVDGFNLYHAIDATKNERLKWLNLRSLAESFLRPEDTIDRVVYFTSVMVWDREKSARHKEYLNALNAHSVECVVSKFQRANKHCAKHDRNCHFYEEKQTDVAIAVRILSDCLTNGAERVFLVTADSDQVPTIAAIRGLRPEIFITVVCPPGRRQIAKELCFVAHGSKEVSTGRLEKCLFPRNVQDKHGKTVAKSPAKYQPD